MNQRRERVTSDSKPNGMHRQFFVCRLTGKADHARIRTVKPASVDLWLRVISAIGLCFLSAVPIRAATSFGIALIHVTIIDVRDGSAKPDMTVLILDGRISAIGSSGVIRTPKHVRVVDGKGKFLIPGLWDMHVHTDGDRRALLSLVQWGITGARDMAGDLQKVTRARRLIAIGDWTGPRLLIAGPRLMGPPAKTDEDVWVIRSPEEARRAVAFLADRASISSKCTMDCRATCFLRLRQQQNLRGCGSSVTYLRR